MCWIERVAEGAVDSRAMSGRIAWAERLCWKAPWTRRAPRYPAAILARWERIVLDLEVAVGWRIWAWAKLLKVWGSLRWSDLQAMIPGEMSMVEGGLSTILRRTKTTGANRRIKELPVCISERVFFEDPTWLAVGFSLLNQGPSGRPAALSPAQDKGERGPREEDGYLRGLQLRSWLWWVSPSWRGPTGRNAASDRFSQHGSASSRYFQRIETCWGDGNPRVRIPTSAPAADGWLDCSTRRRQEQLDERRGRLRVTSAAG